MGTTEDFARLAAGDPDLIRIHQDAEYVAERRAAERLVTQLSAMLADAAELVWHIGDGEGGWVRQTLEEAFDARGLRRTDRSHRAASVRIMLPAATRTRVFELDAYRCRSCGDWHDLAVDHIIPVARGGTDDLANLQTLCRSCNSAKGAKLPD